MTPTPISTPPLLPSSRPAAARKAETAKDLPGLGLPELRHLRTFLTVAETLNISAAARQLHVTQPALSRQVKDLEECVGRALFVRYPNGLKLTPSGVVLRDHVSSALTAVEESLRAARNAAEDGDPMIRVGFYGSVSLWGMIVAPAFDKLKRRHPRIVARMIERSCSQLALDLREGRIDACLLGPGDYGRIPGVEIKVACRIPVYAMMPANHPLAKKRGLEIEDLRDQMIIGVSDAEAPGRYRSVIEACLGRGFYPRLVAQALGHPDLVMAVQHHMALAFVGALTRNVPHPGMVFVKMRPPGIFMDTYAAYAVRAGAAASDLANLLVEESHRIYAADAVA